MGGRKWSDDEINLLEAHYAMRGPRRTRDILERNGHPRSVHAVKYKAKDRLLYAGYTKNDVPLTWLSTGNVHRSHAFTAAKRDGVLKALPVGRPKWVVPKKWADKYAEVVAERANVDGWWTHEDIAQAIGRSETYVRPKLCETPARTHLGRAFRFVERRKDMGRNARMRYRPDQAEQAVGDFLKKVKRG